MNGIHFETITDLGIWQAKAGSIEVKNGPLSLVEKTELTFYKIDPRSGVIDAETTLIPNGSADKIYASLFVTKPASVTSVLWLLLFPQRTHTLRDFALDLFVPINRRDFVVPDGSPLIRTISRISLFVVEIFTLIIRIFTCIPAFLWQRFHNPHPAIQHFLQEEAVFVACQKTWTLKDGEDDLSTSSTVFHWRVDFYPALQNEFEWNGGISDIDNMFHERVVLEGLNGSYSLPRTNFYNLYLTNNYYTYTQRDSGIHLPARLEQLCTRPEIAFL